MNNHGQGKLETTFFNEFQKTCQTSCLVCTQYHTLHVTETTQVYSMLWYPKESLPYDAAEVMLKATNEERGTVAGLAALSQDLEEEHVDSTYNST